ncbi:MAG: hypothetical protein KC457_36275, partial [Myxococcales bacterium]|nr:hypothetical protein [Myxococcales bacterium]
PRTHQVLLLQGGASLQFAMLPLNFAAPGSTVCYADTGAWSSKAIKESKTIAATAGRGHETVVVSSSKASNYDHIPALGPIPEGATYLHVTSNNTIFGTEYETMPEVAVPLLVDASSNIGSRPMGLERAAIGYAGESQARLDPFYIVRNQSYGQTQPRILFILDNSGSMGTDETYKVTPPNNVKCWWFNCEDENAGYLQSRIHASR